MIQSSTPIVFVYIPLWVNHNLSHFICQHLFHEKYKLGKEVICGIKRVTPLEQQVAVSPFNI
ncbi:hypothetical protein HMPREF3293_01114 [Christensenella minuta]|uniref:Uncharacterized protein n=1 Tax=Christensenella minuta TaxID=626937 RepID=A0A136Q5X5_9FIRM|nr:hypothetical protein HMPREF3293_01114 [Christensenella minuta]